MILISIKCYKNSMKFTQYLASNVQYLQGTRKKIKMRGAYKFIKYYDGSVSKKNY